MAEVIVRIMIVTCAIEIHSLGFRDVSLRRKKQVGYLHAYSTTRESEEDMKHFTTKIYLVKGIEVNEIGTMGMNERTSARYSSKE
jgi:hypothetical protein